MADLLGEVDANILPARSYAKKAIKSDNRRKVRVLSPPLTETRKKPARYELPVTELVDTPPTQAEYSDDDGMVVGDDDGPMSDPLPSSPIQKAVERKAKVQIKEEEEDEDIMDVAPAVAEEGVKTTNVNMKGSRPPPKVKQLPSPQSSSPQQPANLEVEADETSRCR